MRSDRQSSHEYQESELGPLPSNSTPSTNRNRPSLPNQRESDFGMSPMMQIFTSIESDKENMPEGRAYTNKRLGVIAEEGGLNLHPSESDSQDRPGLSELGSRTDKDSQIQDEMRVKTEATPAKSTITDEQPVPRSRSKAQRDISFKASDQSEGGGGMKSFTSRYRRRSQLPQIHPHTEDESTLGEKTAQSQQQNLLSNLLGINFPLGLQNLSGIGSPYFLGGFPSQLNSGLNDLQGTLADETVADFVARKDDISSVLNNIKRVPANNQSSSSSHQFPHPKPPGKLGGAINGDGSQDVGVIEQMQIAFDSKVNKLTSICEYLITQCGILCAEAQANRVKYKERGTEIADIQAQLALLQAEQQEQQQLREAPPRNKESLMKGRSRSRRSPRKDYDRSPRKDYDRSPRKDYTRSRTRDKPSRRHEDEDQERSGSDERRHRSGREHRQRRRRSSPSRGPHSRDQEWRREAGTEESQAAEENSEAEFLVRERTQHATARKHSSSRKHVAS